jgi:hypothetical protein
MEMREMMSIIFPDPGAAHVVVIRHSPITLLSRNPLLLLLLLSILLRIQRLHATALLSTFFIFGNGRRCRVIIRSITAADAATAHHHGLDEPWLHHDRMRLTVTLVLAATTCYS